MLNRACVAQLIRDPPADQVIVNSLSVFIASDAVRACTFDLSAPVIGLERSGVADAQLQEWGRDAVATFGDDRVRHPSP